MTSTFLRSWERNYLENADEIHDNIAGRSIQALVDPEHQEVKVNFNPDLDAEVFLEKLRNHEVFEYESELGYRLEDNSLVNCSEEEGLLYSSTKNISNLEEVMNIAFDEDYRGEIGDYIDKFDSEYRWVKV